MSRFRNKLSEPVSGYGLAVILVVCISLTLAGLLVALAANRNSDRKFCDIVLAQTDAYRSTPPSTPVGQELARKMEELRLRLQCPPPKGPQ